MRGFAWGFAGGGRQKLREKASSEGFVDLVFELRLTGEGGGVWTVHVQDGVCDVRSGFSERANVRYTADAKIWCGVALGLIDAADLFKRGLLLKEGGLEAMDHYFHQVSPEGRARPVDQVLPQHGPIERSHA